MLFMLLFLDIKFIIIKKLWVDFVIEIFWCCIFFGNKGVVSDNLFCIWICVILGLVFVLKVNVKVVELFDLEVDDM